MDSNIQLPEMSSCSPFTCFPWPWAICQMITSPSPRQANPRFSIIDHLISFHILGHSRTALLLANCSVDLLRRSYKVMGTLTTLPKKLNTRKEGSILPSKNISWYHMLPWTLWAHPNGKMHVLHLLMTKETAKEEGEVLQDLIGPYIDLHTDNLSKLRFASYNITNFTQQAGYWSGPLLELCYSKTIRRYKIDQFCTDLERVLL